jgi:hypothetical protein
MRVQIEVRSSQERIQRDCLWLRRERVGDVGQRDRRRLSGILRLNVLSVPEAKAAAIGRPIEIRV